MITEQPKKGEYWMIEFGLHQKIKQKVEVIKDTILQFPNWRVHTFKCRYIDGHDILVQGGCFVEKLIT